MDGIALLRQAHEAGLTVLARGGKLVIRGPRRAEPVARLLLDNKSAVMAALDRPPEKLVTPEPERAAWDAADWRCYFDERAAIREFDGRRPRAEAERLAYGETIDAWRRTYWTPPPAWQCAGCGAPLSGAPAIMDLPDGARPHDTPDYACIIAYGRRWRSAATKALAGLGVEPPGGEEP